MSEPTVSDRTAGEPGREERLSALFAQLVMQQSNMALMLLGKVAHPESGQVVKDTEAAQFFIDLLEMLEVKTKGNLGKDEAAILKQSLMSLRLAFVDAVNSPAAPEPPAAPAEPPAAAPAAPAPSDEDEHRKKFTKKY
jgi:hypothetical protein